MTTEPERDQAPIDEQLKEEVAVQHIKDALASDYADAHPAEEVEQAVEEAREHYAEAPIRDFVPNLVEREAKERLAEPEPE